MRALKHTILLILCMLGAKNLFSQNLHFNSASHNFGVIAEDGGKVSHTFTFKNEGSSPVVIISAHSSCGCTVPEYSRQPIAAAGESSVTVTYDPMNRPGKFSKDITLLVAPGNKRYELTISGDVTARKRSTEEIYPFDFGGGLRMKANYFPLSRVEQGGRTETQVHYINNSKRSITVNFIPQVSSAAFKSPTSITIAAGTKGSFAAGYDLSRTGALYGPFSDKLSVKVGGKLSEYDLSFSANGVDRFSEDDRSAPPISNLTPRVIRVGAVKHSSQSAKYNFTVENNGIRDLIVRDVHLDQGLITNLKAGDRVEPSQQRSFQVWVDGSKIDYSSFARYISITMNDPDAPLQRVRVVGEINE